MTLNDYTELCHRANLKWWQNPENGEPIKRNKGELIALIHSEISECFDGENGKLMDDKLPHRKMGEVELVDAMIRIFDYAGGFKYDLNQAGVVIGIGNFENLNLLYETAEFTKNEFYELTLKQMGRGVALIHSRISKVLEHERRGCESDAKVELVRCLVYISAYASRERYSLEGAFLEKMEYNRTREDHKHEARVLAGGKRF